MFYLIGLKHVETKRGVQDFGTIIATFDSFELAQYYVDFCRDYFGGFTNADDGLLKDFDMYDIVHGSTIPHNPKFAEI